MCPLGGLQPAVSVFGTGRVAGFRDFDILDVCRQGPDCMGRCGVCLALRASPLADTVDSNQYRVVMTIGNIVECGRYLIDIAPSWLKPARMWSNPTQPRFDRTGTRPPSIWFEMPQICSQPAQGGSNAPRPNFVDSGPDFAETGPNSVEVAPTFVEPF